MTAKRTLFKRCARQIALESEQRPYGYWVDAEFPVVFERTFEGRQVQVEIVLLEGNSQYVHISVAVDDGGVWAWCPPSYSAIIRKSGIGE